MATIDYRQDADHLRKLVAAASNEEWRSRALCRGMDTNLFFPFPSTPGWKIREATDTCEHCAVRLECLNHALTHNESEGIWGGYSARQRVKMRKALRTFPAVPK